jgi:hypothetical protein
VPGESDAGWADLRAALEADVRRVVDRLGGLSAAQLASMPPPSADGGPPYFSRAQAARAVAQSMVDAAWAMEHAGYWGDRRVLPELADFACADQVAVTGHDLLAAMDLVAPDAVVYPEYTHSLSAREAVERAAWLLADLRRRL